MRRTTSTLSSAGGQFSGRGLLVDQLCIQKWRELFSETQLYKPDVQREQQSIGMYDLFNDS